MKTTEEKKKRNEQLSNKEKHKTYVKDKDRPCRPPGIFKGDEIQTEVKQNGTVTANYIRTMNIDEPLARFTPNSSRFYKQDALGSVIALTDETGVVKTTYSYDPFGAMTITGEASDNPFQYTGRENDNTGLYYYRARYYSPALQRFISEDPIGLAGGDVNFYAYVKNRPTMLVDPMGLKGRGPGTIGDLLVPDDWPTYSFGKCCDAHDECYGCEGKKQGKSKKDCDEEFCKCMLKRCENMVGDSKRSCEGNAKLYCKMVKEYGGSAFDSGRR